MKKSKVPEHIAFIMDGNGRWAKRRGLARIEGHARGLNRIREVIKTAQDVGVKYLTFYAFSSENWKRPAAEVGFLMKACENFIRDELPGLIKGDISLRHIGRLDGLPPSLQQSITRACELTRNNRKLTIQLAFNYGSRQEIVEAVRKISADVTAGVFTIDAIDEDMISRYLYTSGVPDPDLLIRTSGEMRISNFLLWQLSYAEFYCIERCWPDFDRRQFLKAVAEFQKRSRRFGGVDD